MNTKHIPCPRCNGKGCRSSWIPAMGMCYRCKGSGEVCIYFKKHRAALLALRSKWGALKKETQKDLNPDSLQRLSEALERIEKDGKRIRAEIEQCGWEVP